MQIMQLLTETLKPKVPQITSILYSPVTKRQGFPLILQRLHFSHFLFQPSDATINLHLSFLLLLLLLFTYTVTTVADRTLSSANPTHSSFRFGSPFSRLQSASLPRASLCFFTFVFYRVWPTWTVSDSLYPFVCLFCLTTDALSNMLKNRHSSRSHGYRPFDWDPPITPSLL